MGSSRRPLRFIRLEGDCYIPISHKVNKDGYFRYWLYGNKHKFMHRIIWESWYGEVPEGYEIDHICGTRSCCNLDHLRVLSRKNHKVLTNKTRKSTKKEYCRRGHRMVEENLYFRSNGGRVCKECCRIREKKKSRSGELF